ncbi:hypothetical protein LPJ81_004643 [Coemansia sp. IMI 209127]|nr:hypothetical protein LPJ81_004643 [Coemansia sp. IMI 209127]
MSALTELLLLLTLFASYFTPLLATGISDYDESQQGIQGGLFGFNRALGRRVVYLGLALAALINRKKLRVAGTFAYNCFFKRLGNHDNQQKRLNAFYEGQASVYDATRGGLLRGRKTMLRLCAAELERASEGKGGLVWVDVGGGTGWNIEQMDAIFGIRNFERVYLVDLCEPLCSVAEQRFKAKGWTNVVVVCQDAATFKLPGLSSIEASADLVTMSYSLSMIETFYPVVDRLASILKPQTGILGVADFYVSDSTDKSRLHQQPSKHSSPHRLGYHCNWFTRMFWQHWFELDHVFLHPCRRNYLEHVFATHKAFNGRNHFVIPQLIQIPYYVWLGKRPSGTCAAGGSLAQPSTATASGWVRHPYRPERPEHAQFTTYIYAFTWEDPRCDLQVLDLKPGDSLLVITSAGDNALAYAAAHQDQITLHCVDMNPCQNHLLELKLACLRTLEYKQFWQLFGNGQIDGFANILDSILSPWLSPEAYQYWRNNVDTFGGSQTSSAWAKRMAVGKWLGATNLYTTGYSGLALQCLHAMLRLTGTRRAAQRMVENTLSLSEQQLEWRRHMRGWVRGTLATLFLDNPVIMWRLLGVPINQWNMLRSEGSMSQYISDTIEPVMAGTSLAYDNYFYHLLFALRYSPTCCPAYLTKEGFDNLQRTLRADTPLSDRCTFRLHTDTILDVLAKMSPGELTKAVIMDHMDWFSEDSAQQEVSALARVIAKGGFVLWRSAARLPWYVEVFEKNGFAVEPISVRQPNTMQPLDRVNMYASFYKATKL